MFAECRDLLTLKKAAHLELFDLEQKHSEKYQRLLKMQEREMEELEKKHKKQRCALVDKNTEERKQVTAQENHQYQIIVGNML